MSVRVAVDKHIGRLEADAGESWSSAKEVRAELARSLADEIDAGDTGRGQPRTSGLVKELRATLEELEPKEVADAGGDPDPPAWLDVVRSTVQHSS